MSTLPRHPGEAAFTDAIENPAFNDLPYVIETTRTGQLILSPHWPHRSMQQWAVLRHIEAELGAVNILGVGVCTPEGVKVPGAIWMPETMWQEVTWEMSTLPFMPPLMVEVMTAFNTYEEMHAKARLYFEGALHEEGAKEVWIVSPSGHVEFYTRDGGRVSQLAPTFPDQIGV